MSQTAITRPAEEAIATPIRPPRGRRFRGLMRGRLAPLLMVILGLATLAVAAFWLRSSWGLIDPCRSANEIDRICNIPPRWMTWLQFGLGITGSFLAIAGGIMLLRGAFAGRLSHRMRPISLTRAIIAGAWTVVYLVGRAMV